MTIYKTVLQIIKQSRGTVIIGLILTGIFTFFYARQLTNQYNELSGADIAIVDQDNSEVSKSLEKMLDKQQRVISLEDISEKGQDDALYFGNVNYIVTIPKGFGSSLSTESPIKVRSQTKPGSFSKALVDSSINRFIATYLLFDANFPSSTQQEVLKMVEKNVEKEGKVNFDKSYQEKVEQQLTARIYNILSYGMFMTIFSGYALVNLVFNRKEISERNECSPISKVTLSRRISLANLVYSFICFIIFMIMLFIMTQASFNLVTLYFLINSLLFLSVIISFSILVTSVIKNSETMSGINNIFILGSCFISGAFVPSSLFPEVVNKIAAFVPTYWFVANNELIGNTLSFNHEFSNKFFKQSFILIGFTCVFLLIHFILIKESSRKHRIQKMIG